MTSHNSLPSATFFSGKRFGEEMEMTDGEIPILGFSIESLVTINTNLGE